MKKRILATFLALCLAVSLLPVTALADELGTGGGEPSALTAEYTEVHSGLGSVYDVQPAPMFQTFGLVQNPTFDWNGGKAYYNQLDSDSKEVYDTILESSLGTGYSAEAAPLTFPEIVSDSAPESFDPSTITVYKDADGNVSYSLGDDVSTWSNGIITPAVLALTYDQPKLSWLVNAEYSIGYSFSHNVSTQEIAEIGNGEEKTFEGKTVTISGLTFSLTGKFNNVTLGRPESITDTGNMSDIDSAIVSAKEEINTSLTDSSTKYEKVKAIHDYVCNTVSYVEYAPENKDTALAPRKYQTVHSALVDQSHTTVCAGYAKAFKVLCDAYSIPCVLVSGTGNSNGNPTDKDAHMWNYVQMEDNQWYAVDCTWDDSGDPQTPATTFFLVGAGSTDGDVSFNESHQESGRWGDSSYEFIYPKLADSAYTPPATLTGITVGVKDSGTTTVNVPTEAENTKTINLTATANYDSEPATTDVTSEATWTLQNGPVTGVSVANGVVTIQPSAGSYTGNTTFTVQAAYQGKEGTIAITLNQKTAQAVALTISSDADSIERPGTAEEEKTLNFTVSGEDQYGEAMENPSVTWSVVDSDGYTPTGVSISGGVLTVDNTASEGTVTIKATSTTNESVYATKNVTITKAAAVVTTVEISGGVDSLTVPGVDAVGSSKTEKAATAFTATVKDQYGGTITGQTVTWKVSGNPGVTIDDAGYLTITNEATDATVTVTASCSGVTSTERTVTVTKAESAATFVQILRDGQVITTDTIVIPSNSTTVSYSAKVYDQYGAEMTGQAVTWTFKGNETGATFDSGAVTVTVLSTAQAGEATLTAQRDEASESITIAITNKANCGIYVEGTPISLTYGDTPFTLTATAQNPGENPVWTWSTDASGVLKVTGNDNTATVEILKAGTATVTVTYSSDTTYGTLSTKITVEPADLNGATVSVSDVSNTYTGSAQTPTVTVTLGSTSLNGDTDYEVTYTPAVVKNAGGYTVTVTGKGNYQGIAETTFAIEKAAPAIGEVTYTSTAPIYESTALGSINLSRTNNDVDGSLTLDAGQTLTAGINTYNWTFTPTDTINYETVYGTVQLNVQADALKSVSVKSDPSKTTYVHGDTFDKTGLVLTAIYASGVTKEISADEITVVTTGPLTCGMTEVTVSYQGIACQVPVTVNQAPYSNQTVNVSAAYTDTAEKNVDLTWNMPNDRGEITAITIDGTPDVTLLASRTDPTTGKPVLTYALKDALTTDDVGKTVSLTYKVSTQNYEDFTITVAINVTEELTSGALFADVPTFADVYVGYAQPAAGTITIRNSGNSALTIASVTVDSANFVLGGTQDKTVPAAGTNTTWTIRPVAGLPAGTYRTTVTVVYNGGASNTESPVEFTVKAVPTPTPTPEPSYPSTGGSSSGGSSSGNKTETSKNPDGSTTTTVTSTNGTVTETTRNPDGSKEVVETKKDGTVTTTTTDKSGNQTKTVENPNGSSETTVTNKDGSSSTTTVSRSGQVEAEVKLPASVVNDAGSEAVALPMPSVPVTTSRASAPTVTVDLPSGRSAKVEIPVEDVTPGTVAVIVKADGSEEVIKTSVTTETGVAVTLADGDTVKIVDNSKTFYDVSGSYWGADAIDFATSRELFSGTSSVTFEPETAMNRAMIVTVLARLDDVDTTVGATWYEAGQQWAILNGISDGSNMEQNLTREQLATMLYRYAQSAGYDVTNMRDLGRYSDAADVSDYAVEALQWATAEGLVTSMGDGTLNPQGPATRTQVATILMRFLTK